MPDLVRVADYKKRDAYAYALAVGSSFVHLAIVKHITLCQKTVSSGGTVASFDNASQMCPKCVGKAGTRTITLRRRT